jgi:hypothetical protein
LSFSDTKYDEKFVSRILGIPTVSAIFEYLKALDSIIDPKEGIKVLEGLEKNSVDSKLFARELTFFARIILLARHKLIKDEEISENYGEHILEFVKEFLGNKTPKINSQMLAKIIESENISKNSSLPFLVYELHLL